MIKMLSFVTIAVQKLIIFSYHTQLYNTPRLYVFLQFHNENSDSDTNL